MKCVHSTAVLSKDFIASKQIFKHFAAVCSAVDGFHTVVHLAACVDVTDVQQLLQVNVVGTYNLFESSRRAGVKRIVFGSSGATVMGYEKEEPYSAMVQARYADVPVARPMILHLVPDRPTTLYGCTKVWGETLGRYYAEVHGISVLCIRLGRVVLEDRPSDARHAAAYLSHRECECKLSRNASMLLRISSFISSERGVRQQNAVPGYSSMQRKESAICLKMESWTWPESRSSVVKK